MWQVEYHATALLVDSDSSACAQDNGAVPQPQSMTFRRHCFVCVCVCVFYSVAVKYALSLFSYSHYINPTIGGCYVYRVS